MNFNNARLIFIFLLLLTGCSGGESESRVDSGNRDGVFHFGNHAEPQGLDPHIVTGIPEHHILTALFEGLVLKNPYTLDIEPGVAESWDISADGLTYTFRLRENTSWSNGDVLTAEDFRWSWQRALSPILGSEYSYMYYPIENAEAYNSGQMSDFSQVGVTVLDEHTLQVKLHSPTPYFLQLLDHYSMFPVHRATLEAFGSASDRLTAWAQEGNIVTNGAFVLTEWQINSHVRVEKSPLYWDAEEVDLKAIVFYPTENLVTEERMFRDRQLHRTAEIPLDKIFTYQQEQLEVTKIAPWIGSYFYMFNTTRAPLNDVRVRKALAMSIDRTLIAETVTQGVYSSSTALVPPGTLGYQPPQLFTYDPEKAVELLAEAGYPNGDGFPAFDFLYNTNEDHRKIAVAIQQMWMKTLNITVNLVNQEWKVYLDSHNNMNYDVARRGWIGDYVDPYTFLGMYITDGGNNKTGFSNARYDEIILHEAPAELDKDKRFALYYEAETILLENMPILPIFTYQFKHLYQTSVKGMPNNIMDYYNYKYVSLDPEG
ncbi:MAG: peptide ABC transporter substrate-binding protein [Gammaproteobacteria bacterium]|nr:peptide ABC transporter substrate-binding protein [Gammaproteobacteria bacterium]